MIGELSVGVCHHLIGKELRIAPFVRSDKTWEVHVAILIPNDVFSIDLRQGVTTDVFEPIEFTGFGTSAAFLRHLVLWIWVTLQVESAIVKVTLSKFRDWFWHSVDAVVSTKRDDETWFWLTVRLK